MADLQEHLDRIEALGARVVAASADPPERARGTADDLDLGFTVLYGLDPEETSRKIGCYTGTREGRPHVQPAAFVLDPEGRVALAVYSSGKVGRLTGGDAVTFLEELAS